MRRDHRPLCGPGPRRGAALSEPRREELSGNGGRCRRQCAGRRGQTRLRDPEGAPSLCGPVRWPRGGGRGALSDLKSCPEAAADAAGNVRVAEAKRACEILKARPLFAGQCDGHAVVDAAHYREFRDLIDAERPDVLFTHWPIDGHRDHRAISMLAYDAWLATGKKFAFYYYEVSDGEDTLMFPPTDFVDIAATEPRKRLACYAHASQAPDKFYALQSQVTRFRGVESGYLHAEAYVRHAQSRESVLP